jgi:lipopolysaccharide/colanic/teichoic acid biosynthesis glycosyltransferase
VANLEVQLREYAPQQRDSAKRQLHAPPVLIRARPGLYARYGKRPLDVVLAAVGLVLLAPLLLALALLVRVKLGRGGVIYRQQRVGMNGKTFEIYKFRSMLPDRRRSTQPYIGPERRQGHKTDNDPRHTPFGRFLRANSLDELPQLLNVIKGDMSLIGPRPEMVTVASERGYLVHPRHLERPGITGRFQISDLRSTNNIAKGLHLDLAYVANVRFRSDLAILLRTFLVLFGRGS